MLPELLSNILGIVLKARIWRELQRAHTAFGREYSEKELLIIEVINYFAPITDKQLRKMFALSPTVTNAIVTKFIDAGLLQKGQKTKDDGRKKPLSLTKQGKKFLEALQETTERRYQFWFSMLSPEDQEKILPVIRAINEAGALRIEEVVKKGLL